MATECTLFQKKKNRNPKPKIKGEASEMLRVERGFKKLRLSKSTCAVDYLDYPENISVSRRMAKSMNVIFMLVYCLVRPKFRIRR